MVEQVRWATFRFALGALLPGLALILALATTSPDPVEAAESRASEPRVLWHETSTLLPMSVYEPAEFDSSRAYPAVIALHGFGGSSERFERIGRAFARSGFITVVPEGPYRVYPDEPGRHSTWELNTWTEELDLGPPLTDDPAIEAKSIALTVDEFFPNVVDRIRDEYHVDRVYLFGFSLGGVYALVGGFLNRDRFDGIIAFGAQFYREVFTARGDRLEEGNHLAIRLAVGRSDPMVPLSHADRARDAFEESGYEVAVDKFDGGHAVPDDALGRAVDWLVKLADRDR